MNLVTTRNFQQPTTAASCWCVLEVIASSPSELAVSTVSRPESHIGLQARYAGGMLRNLSFIGEDKNRGARFM